MWRAYSYFRTGVGVEGEAWFCVEGHGPFASFGGETIAIQRLQHIDVEVRFWNRRRDPVAILGVAEINLPLRETELAVADWLPFKEVTLPAGGSRQTRKFALVPSDAPEERVEAAAGDPLELEFRPSRGSERWARPRLSVSVRAR
jgi:hypothetical protein